jgi:xanthine dehydrogenase accessory factor
MADPTLFVAGAGHVGRAVADLATWLGHDVAVWDDRDEVLSEFPGDATVISGPIESAVVVAPVTTETSVVVVTRNVDLDLRILPVLLTTPAPYIGVMGSRRRWSTTSTELAARGLPAEALGRIKSPIGLEIHAETPEEIAVSILSEVTEQRRDS